MAGSVLRRLAALLVLHGAAAGWAGAADEPAVALLTPVPLTPARAAGSGEGPTVKARFTITETGRVTAVEIVSSEPAGTQDELFANAVRATLADWRFRPAQRDGKPVAVSQERVFRFPALPASGDVPLGHRGLSASALADARDAGASLMPDDFRRRRMEELVRAAEAPLSRKTRREAASGHVVAVTDVDEPAAAQVFATNVMVTLATVNRMLDAHVPEQPARGKLHVYVYRTRAQFELLLKDVGMSGQWAGFYFYPGLLAFHTEVSSASHLISIMLHEATHAYVERHTVRPGVQMPHWLGEGFAEYIGNSEIKDGRLVAGSRRQKSTWTLTAHGVHKVATAGAARARDARRASSANREFGLAYLLRSTREQFYSDPDVYYAKAYVAVHFLRHGRPEWQADAFPRFMLYVAEGYSPDAAFRLAYGADPEQFDAEYRKYERRM